MGRFDKLNDDDDVLTPGPAVPPPEPRVPQRRPILMMPRPARVPLTPEELLAGDDLPIDPNEWLYAIFEEGRDITVVFTPIAYWEAHRSQIDTHVSEAIEQALPDYLQGREEGESTFYLPDSTRDAIEIGHELQRRGFRFNPEFAREIT